MWIYSQSSGKLSHAGEGDVCRGYSGCSVGKNNPASQHVPNMGPIPRGLWDIVGPPYSHPSHGPVVLQLHPRPGTETFGRTHFLMHGDSIHAPGTASLGCVIMPHDVRQRVWDSGDHLLSVVE